MNLSHAGHSRGVVGKQSVLGQQMIPVRWFKEIDARQSFLRPLGEHDWLVLVGDDCLQQQCLSPTRGARDKRGSRQVASRSISPGILLEKTEVPWNYTRASGTYQ